MSVFWSKIQVLWANKICIKKIYTFNINEPNFGYVLFMSIETWTPPQVLGLNKYLLHRDSSNFNAISCTKTPCCASKLLQKKISSDNYQPNFGCDLLMPSTKNLSDHFFFYFIFECITVLDFRLQLLDTNTQFCHLRMRTKHDTDSK